MKYAAEKRETERENARGREREGVGAHARIKTISVILWSQMEKFCAN